MLIQILKIKLKLFYLAAPFAGADIVASGNVDIREEMEVTTRLKGGRGKAQTDGKL